MLYFCSFSNSLLSAFLIEADGCLCGVRFATEMQESMLAAEFCETPLLQQAKCQLQEYFAGKRKEFSLPLQLQGTPFQKKVWQALLTIPYGQTATYGQIATQIGSPKACRAVGMANHRNPLAILIPCHRVIGANGTLTGYGGGLSVKQALLALEDNYK